MTNPSKNKTYRKDDYERQVVPSKSTQDYRSVFRRDYARLIHSSAFRRLQGKTQLYPGHESDFFRNRLTHSLEVAQIAKGIALKINGEDSFFRSNPIDLDLVEFAGLAHDLGHAPFGHNGEEALDDCMKKYGGFEGNAQTLRFLAVIEKKETIDGVLEGIRKDGQDCRVGLNPTYRTLASVLKYDTQIPLRRIKSKGLVKGYYCSERDLVAKIRERVAPHLSTEERLKTIECQIMDLADDIAYSTYDLEDGLKGGFVDPLMLMSSLAEDPDLLKRVTEKVQKDDALKRYTQEEVLKAVGEVFENQLPVRDPNGTTPDCATCLNAAERYSATRRLGSSGYSRTEFTSELVEAFIEGIQVKADKKYPALSKVWLDPAVKLKVETLKHLNYEIMIMSPRLRVVQFRGYEIVQSIFKALDDDHGHHLLPSDYRENYLRLKGTDEKKRMLCDFVAGMTDRYAVEFYGRLKQGDQSIFKPF